MTTQGHSMRERFFDVAAVALAVTVAALAALDEILVGPASTTYIVVSIAVSAVGCTALLWRRRWPVGVAVLLLPMAAVTEVVGGAVLIAVFTVAVRRRLLVAVLVGASHVLVGVPYSLIRPDPNLSVIGYNILAVALLSVPVAWGAVVRSRRELIASLRERASRAEAEAAWRAERFRSLERERIAREMHDVLAHRISLVSLHAGALEIRPDLTSAEVAQAAGTIRASAHQALEDLREILGVLRAGEDGTQPQPGLADLGQLVGEARSSGTTVTVEDRLPAAEVLPSSASRTAYRVVQEGLTNARKHAPSAEVSLQLGRTSDGELHVWLRNRRCAAPPTPPIPGSGSGLVGIAERVSIAGGRLDHGARRGEGGIIEFHLEVWLPWPR